MPDRTDAAGRRLVSLALVQLRPLDRRSWWVLKYRRVEIARWIATGSTPEDIRERGRSTARNLLESYLEPKH